MAKIIAIHSFRGGTGKSNITANLAAAMALDGQRVGIVDTDIQSPGIHVLLGLTKNELVYALNDYLWEHCSLEQAAYDVGTTLDKNLSGKVYLIPSSIKADEIARVLNEGFSVHRLVEGFRQIIQDLDLDVLFIDTHPGMNRETLLSIAISDILVVLLRPDAQDYQGTSVTIEVARKLDIKQMWVLANKVPSLFDFAEVQRRIEEIYDVNVAAVLPHSDEMMALASEGVFVLRYPEHALSAQIRQVAAELLANK